jgi:hypothetical protein
MCSFLFVCAKEFVIEIRTNLIQMKISVWPLLKDNDDDKDYQSTGAVVPRVYVSRIFEHA